MFVKKITLDNFRNAEYAQIELSDGLNVFFGENAQGKTNILEAIFLCSASKSFRRSKDDDFIRFGSEKAHINTAYFDGKNDADIDMVFKKDERCVKFDGFECKRSGEYIGKLPTVVFTPDHLSLVKSAPEERRKYLDLALCQARPAILSVYRDYGKIIRQKTALLRKYKEGEKPQYELFEIYNENLSKLCEKIAVQRKRLCEKLTDIASLYYEEMAPGGEKLDFRYVSCIKSGEFSAENYEKTLKEGLETELSSGIAFYGIHRDDIRITLNQKNIREFGSQGQQRSCVISMKLAEGDFLAENRGDMPVFLFDDILSELDSRRREYIVGKIPEKQVILTSCNGEYVSDKSINKYMVKNGNYIRV